MTEKHSTDQPHPPGWTLDPTTNQWRFDPDSPEVAAAGMPPMPAPVAAVGPVPLPPAKQPSWASRHKVIVGIVAAVLVLGVIGGIGSAASYTGKGGATRAAVKSTNPTDRTTEAPTSEAAATEAPTTEDTTTPATLTGLPLGQKITVTDDSGAEGWVRVSKVTSAYIQYDSPKHGRFVRVWVTYHCTTGTLSYNELDWTISARNGQEYQNTWAENELDSGNLHHSGTTSGWVYFDVTKSKLATVNYVPNYNGDPLATWTI
jgi:hypothetical protein